MIASLPEAAPARRRVQEIAKNWDPVRNGQLLGERDFLYDFHASEGATIDGYHMCMYLFVVGIRRSIDATRARGCG